MAGFSFYAVTEDLRQLFHFLFEETDVRVFESYSEPDAVLREFRSYQELTAAFAIGVDEYGNGNRHKLQLWSPRVTQAVSIGRFDLKPTVRRSQKFRHSISGVGLIQLYLGGRHENQITESHYGHWNEAGARQRSCGNVDEVDWAALKLLSGRVQRHLRNRLAAAKVESLPILAGAYAEMQAGARVRHACEWHEVNSPLVKKVVVKK
jgi:hypothetical protein